jgi:hypothetical protein
MRSAKTEAGAPMVQLLQTHTTTTKVMEDATHLSREPARKTPQQTADKTESETATETARKTRRKTRSEFAPKTSQL